MVENQRDPTSLDGLLPSREELNAALTRAEELLEKQSCEIEELKLRLASQENINNLSRESESEDMFVSSRKGVP